MGECSFHKALTISRHNATCQLAHVDIRKSAKGGGGAPQCPGLSHGHGGCGFTPANITSSLETVCFARTAEENTYDVALHTHQEWLDPLPSTANTRNKRHTDVSQDPRFTHQGLTASTYVAGCTTALNLIPSWVLPTEETQALFHGGYGTAPYLIYARGVPDTPDPGTTNFDKKLCTLILIEIGFSRDLGCNCYATENR